MERRKKQRVKKGRGRDERRYDEPESKNIDTGSKDGDPESMTGSAGSEAGGAESKKGGKGRKRSPLLTVIILIVIFVVGLGLLLYPTLSDYINSLHQSRAIESYGEAVEEYTKEELDAVWDAAVEYNEHLHEGGSWSIELDSDEEIASYESQLNIGKDGMMGYIEIAKISCYLPIYHGTTDAVLSRNIGHLEGTHLPVGGVGTHSVLSGHRGLTSARLFTDLDQLTTGDTFTLHILDRTLTYEVDQILIVLPDEISALAPDPNEDYCTLVTCTPYGVNSHRLLVRGHRIENEDGVVRVPGDALQLDSSIVAPIVAVPILIVLLIVLLVATRRRRRRK